MEFPIFISHLEGIGNANSATVAVSKESKHEGFRSKMDEFDEKLLKFPKSIHHGLHKGADKTSHKVTDGTKKMFKHNE
ncbi:hypothetical protein Cantr_08106 [Candida viswanathii]|uniref:Uncharacterized protein n=1 Tax=Candida viswanathii TaxID=5486 RepID=A0A367Y5A9_9ASCO|nr:hypothetical protein Cantr_08106 [Candida viswanathii]